MSIDLTKLTPAPWLSSHKTDTLHLPRPGEIGFAELIGPTGGRYRGVWFPLTNTEADFLALARNAFDVVMRRGWVPRRSGDEWYVPACLKVMTKEQYQNGGADAIYCTDPFSALVEADAWYKANVESGDGKEVPEG